ncbi:hypothetical protein [Dictyobacter aurantiacus]|uniref:hypothetical protein n=1 Tax=Dictyobacter aurantiacus TaxID=1936993 RepID=UPI000F843C0A|nr:hypothetical protein [Dictyobacter aurantiacus]
MTDDTAYACSSRYLAAHDTLRSAGPIKKGDFMSQSLFQANICVRKISISSSIQAQGTGGFMSQKWRIYGLSDKSFLCSASSPSVPE